MTMNGAVLPVLALYIVAAEEQGVQPDQLTGTIQNDILKEFMVRNTYIYPPKPSMQIISDIFAFTSHEMPRFNSISISGYHIQEAGATADLELAYTLADGVEYLKAGKDAGHRRRQVRAAAVVLLGHRHELLHGGREAAGRAAAVGQAREGGRGAEPEVPGAAHPLADLGLVADGAGRLQQRRPHLPGGHGRHPGAHPVAAHQRLGRGAGAADRLLRPDRPQHPAAAAAGVGDDAGHRPVGRVGLRGEADLRPRPARLGAHRGGRRARRHGAGDRRRHPEAAHRGGRGPHAGPHRLRPAAGHRRQQVPGGRRRGDRGAAGRQRRRARPAEGQAGAAARRRGTPPPCRRRWAGSPTPPARPRRDGGAATSTRTCSSWRSTPPGRRRPWGRSPTRWRRSTAGTPGRCAPSPVCTATRQGAPHPWTRPAAWPRSSRRPRAAVPRILVAKMGQDGHDRGQKVIATAFADLGFDVDVGPLFQTPEEVARQAVEADVHVVGVSSLAAGHLTLVPALRTALADLGADDVMIVVGGVIPPDDVPTLEGDGCRRGLPARHGHRRGRAGPAARAVRRDSVTEHAARNERSGAGRGSERRSTSRRSSRGCWPGTGG